MGAGASSKFKCSAEAGGGGRRRPRPDWLADPCSKLVGKAENFTTLTGIGKGKFGFVYLCRHSPSQKHVAVKFISKAFVNETQSLVRLNQEIALLQLVDHPFIVHCFCGYETPTCVALVFEYAHGGELFTYMKRNNRMGEDHARFYFCEIALALSYLHENLETLYRDLKPENVLIDYEGHIKLCDFGFAVQHSAEGLPLHDGCGTAMYVAPEIAGGFMKCAHSFPVDWWGAGCVLAEMVTGKAPFGDTDSSSKFEVFNNINQKPPNLPMRSCSSQLRVLLRGLLDKDPKKRFAWADVKRSDWLREVSWTDLLNRAVTPPWQPALKPEPTTDNFVSWNDMKLPSKPVDAAAVSYMRGVELPRPRAAKGSFATPSDPSSSTSSSSAVAATASEQPSPRGQKSKKATNGALASSSPQDELLAADESKRGGSPEQLSVSFKRDVSLKRGMSVRASSSRKFGADA